MGGAQRRNAGDDATDIGTVDLSLLRPRPPQSPSFLLLPMLPLHRYGGIAWGHAPPNAPLALETNMRISKNGDDYLISTNITRDQDQASHASRAG